MTFLSGFVSDCMIDYAWMTCRLVPFFLNWDKPLRQLQHFTWSIWQFRLFCLKEMQDQYCNKLCLWENSLQEKKLNLSLWSQVSFLYLQSRDSIAPLQPLLRCKRSHWARNLNRYRTWRWNNARHFSLFYRKKKQKFFISRNVNPASPAYRRLKKISTKGSSMIGSNQSREYNQTWRRQERKAVSGFLESHRQIFSFQWSTREENAAKLWSINCKSIRPFV